MRATFGILAVLLVVEAAGAQIRHGDQVVVVVGADRVRARTRPQQRDGVLIAQLAP